MGTWGRPPADGRQIPPQSFEQVRREVPLAGVREDRDDGTVRTALDGALGRGQRRTRGDAGDDPLLPWQAAYSAYSE
ncbi:hypothetical protein [Halostella salina]|uniref:hypothetical protein n=1 Tax=Halostella salina TaxID=1547897 RepID=UPI0013CE75D6